MRLLILSDIHANITGLEAALKAAEGRWDKAVCLGDVVGYGPDPNEATDRVRPMVISVIRGNHDKACAGITDAEDFNPVARAAALWTRDKLTPENLTYLKDLPIGPVQAEGITMVHGAYRDEDEYVFAPAQALDGLLGSPTDITFFGHTHFQGGFSFQDNRIEVIGIRPAPPSGTPSDGKDQIAMAALRIERGTRYLLNPGSTGQPRDGDPRAGFAIADLANAVVEFWRVPYEIEPVQRRMLEAGLPEPLALRLSFGR
ncbi:MAG: metallophosphoesterase family protein [Acidobacteria bacterium]|nr:metallophosphoesterase family protein [Acidobacteriota bacterium]